ncbi:MAG: carbohydrate kinase family protein [Candidatus Hodarchaeota archaeon]
MENKSLDLACIGSCCFDVIMNVQDVLRFEMMDVNIVKKYTAIEYSSKLNVMGIKLAPGGSAANVSANLGGFGLKTSYIGKLGDDSFGKVAIEDLGKAGVELDSCFLTSEDSTGVSVILITPFGKDRSILAYKGANNLIRPEEIQDHWVTRAKNLQWTSLTSDSGVNAIEKCISLLRSSGGNKVFACPSISILKNHLEGAKRLIKQSDVLICNKEEIAELTGENDTILAMKKVLAMGPKIVACTDGKDGSKITDGKDLITADVYNVDVVDTTGAGDAFASGIIYACINELGLEAMVKYGAAIAANECAVLGVRDGIPRDIVQIKEFIRDHDLYIVKSSLES